MHQACLTKDAGKGWLTVAVRGEEEVELVVAAAQLFSCDGLSVKIVWPVASTHSYVSASTEEAARTVTHENTMPIEDGYRTEHSPGQIH